MPNPKIARDFHQFSILLHWNQLEQSETFEALTNRMLASWGLKVSRIQKAAPLELEIRLP